jgi:glycosyltransferase involved in cell wall biosynthesis
MSKIRILAIPSDQHGVGKYRILDPYKYIAENHSDDVHVDIALNVENNDESFLNYDVVVLHSFIHKLPHEDNVKRINWLKSKGIKVVVDIDDLWAVDQRHPMFRQIKDNKIAEKKVELLKLADYVTTTTPIFAETIKKRLGVKNVEIFPNAVNPDESQFQPKPTKSDKIRFGWLGGSSHLHDIELMSQGISSIVNLYKEKSQFILCGFDLRGTVTEILKDGTQKKRDILPYETIWFRYESIFTDKYKSVDEDYRNYLLKFSDIPYDDSEKSYIRKWTQEINTYANNYNNFDVSLAPLVDSEFNANKSQLKIIEAGFHKKAIIASDVKPYTLDLISAIDVGSNQFNSKGNALVVPPSKNHKLWSKHMKKLIENPNMIEDMGNRLYETVKDKYSLKNVSKDRVEFFKSIINN